MAPSATTAISDSIVVHHHASKPVASKPYSSRVRASVLHGARDLKVESRELELPGDDDVQVAIRATGICGSDVSYYKKFANGDLCACEALSLGHESSGVVVAMGKNVRDFKCGDRVALEVGVPCNICTTCRRGRYNLCKKLRFRSSAKSFPHYQGTLQERINHPAQWCHRLPEHISFDAAALLEPLSVAIHAVNRAAPTPGSTALVIGAGTVGLLTAAMARQSGCTIVAIADVDEGRVNYAVEKGFATHGKVVGRKLHTSVSSSSICNSNSGTSTPNSGTMTPASLFGQLDDARRMAQELVEASKSTHPLMMMEDDDDDDDGYDVTFECTGKEICMQTSMFATKCGGKVIMVGMGTPIQTLPMSAAHLREVDILGIFRYANTYRTGIRLLNAAFAQRVTGTSGGGFHFPSLDDMVTHRFKGLENAKGAFELASRTVDNDGNLVLKVVIEA